MTRPAACSIPSPPTRKSTTSYTGASTCMYKQLQPMYQQIADITGYPEQV
jgi:hypothetical protein